MPLAANLSSHHWHSADNQRLGPQSTARNSPEETNHTLSALTDCLVLDPLQFIPWDNPDNIVSSEVENLTRVLTDVVILPIFFLFGCPANIINMTVFYRQGLKERINVCLFALSLADGLYLIVNIVSFGEQLHLQFINSNTKYGPVFQFLSDNSLLGLFGFMYVSQILSAIIAVDRCFCIMHPLRSQNIIRASTMAYAIVIINLTTVGLFFFLANRYRVGCFLNPLSAIKYETFVPGEFYLRHQDLMDKMDYCIFGTGLPGAVITVVISTTIITAVKLREAAAWRAGTSTGSGVSQRDIALTKMLVASSVFFIACVVPFAVVKLTFLFMPEMGAGGRRHNFYIMAHHFILMSSYVNSACNIVVYYVMGSRFRQIFWQLFGRGTVKTK